MKRIYSYIEAKGQSFRPPRQTGPDSEAVIYLAKIDSCHYVAVTGVLPPQAPAIELRGPLELASDPALRAELDRRAEPWRQVRERRAEQYPALADQFDALITEFAARRQAGEKLTPQLSRIIDACMAVKADNPKPDIGLG